MRVGFTSLSLIRDTAYTGLISSSKAKVKGMYFVKKKNKGKQLQHDKKDRKKNFDYATPHLLDSQPLIHRRGR